MNLNKPFFGLPLRAAVAVAAIAVGSTAFAQTEITVQYAMPQIMKEAMTVIADDFMKANPAVKVRFLIPAESYSDLLQKSLRASMTQQLPDVSFQALGYLRTFVDRRAAVDLDPLIAADGSFKTRGDDPAMLQIGKLYGKQYGLPFAISAPLIYYNSDLIRKAGGDPDKFPTTWRGIADLAAKVAALPDTDSGIHIPMAAAPDWYWQLLVNSFGGKMIDEKKMTVAFNGPEGLAAMQTLADLRDRARMSANASAGQQSFFAGRSGIWVASSAVLGQSERAIGSRFKWAVAAVPRETPDARMPAGGNLAVIHATDPEKKKAAFSFIQFATGKIGSTHQVKLVGYMSPNASAVSDPTLLGNFYRERPLYAQSSKLAPNLAGWYTYPGDNGLKITDAIKRSVAAVMEGRADAKDALSDMAIGVQSQLPKP
jgi:multiple sugar transport system substrate-binding protein